MGKYIHGAFAELEASQDYVSPAGVGTIPVYFGCAPLGQLADTQGKVNTPLLLHSWADAQRQIGYSDDWERYGLCEAVYAHFRNSIQSVGPIVVVNALDPQQARSSVEKTAEVQFSKRSAVLPGSNILLSSVRIPDKQAGVDFTAEYSADGMQVLLHDLSGELGTTEIHYYELHTEQVDENRIIQAIKEGLPRVYYELHEVPTILCAPGYSQHKTVYEALVNAAERINGHWYAYVNADLDSAALTSIDAAIEAKHAYPVESGISSLLWPMARKGERIYHASVLQTVTMQRVDFNNGNLPYESPSNKAADVASLCLADGSAINYDQTESNRLNAAGITTLVYWEGSWRMWGPHTAAFAYERTSMMDARDIFDSNVRMVHYIANTFQRQYGNDVDKPMTRARKDSILNDFQARIDRWIADGALLEGNITFEEAENPLSDLVQGNFVFEVEGSTPIPGKNLSARVRWTAQGLSSLFGGESA